MSAVGPVSGSLATPTEDAVFVSNWIINRRTDLMWFIGGSVLGYGMFLLYIGVTQEEMMMVWFLWYMLLDVPHFFGTYARTYLDTEEMRVRRRLLLGSLSFLLCGPSIILLCAAIYQSPLREFHLVPYKLLIAGVSLWAYWHVVRQHYGIMALYRRKNNDFHRIDNWIDKSILYVGLIAPFFAFVVRNEEARRSLFLPGAIPNYASGFGWEDVVVWSSVAALSFAAVAFVVRQMQRWWQGRAINLPKTLFLFSVVPLHMLVCYHSASVTASVLSFSAFVTIFHDVQYHCIVYHYQKNRCHGPEADPSKYGLAAKISRNFPTYMICAMAMGVVAAMTGCLLEMDPGCMPFLRSSTINVAGGITLQDFFIAFYFGIVMHHYFVDQFIWRPSKSRQLQKDLKIEGKATA